MVSIKVPTIVGYEGVMTLARDLETNLVESKITVTYRWYVEVPIQIAHMHIIPSLSLHSRHFNATNIYT